MRSCKNAVNLVEVSLKTSIVTLTPSVNFKQLYEPDRTKYSHKQETFATQVRNILEKQCPDDKKGRSWIKYFEDCYDTDIQLQATSNRNKLDIYALDNTNGYKNFIKTISPVSKPSELYFADYAYYTKEEARSENKEFLVKLGLLITGIAIFVGVASKKNIPNTVTEKAKTEIGTNILKKLPADTLELTTKLIK